MGFGPTQKASRKDWICCHRKKTYPAVDLDLDLAIEILLFQEELMDFSSSYVGLMEAYTSLMGCIVSSLCMEIWKERP